MGDAYAALADAGYSDTQANTLANYFMDMLESGDLSGPEMSEGNFRGLKQSIYTALRGEGGVDRAASFADQVWDGLSESQKAELRKYFKGLGYALDGG